MFLKLLFFNCLIICLIQSSVIAKRAKPPKKVILSLLKGKRPTIPRIVGGQAIEKHEFPWMCSLQYAGQHFCGATIISSEWAVTAAHCIDDTGPRPFEVVCGGYNLSNKESTEKRVGHKITITHEKWNAKAISDDIGLIKFNETIDLISSNPYIKSIDLPPDNIELIAGASAVATGWGLTDVDSAKVSDIPLKVTLPLVSQSDCSRNYGQQINIYKTMLCTGGSKGAGICNGDSGGPLNLLVNGIWTFVGLDSFTVPCAVQGFPSVFTRINRYNNWIRKKVKLNS